MIKIGFNRGNNQPNGTFLALLQDEECQKYLRLLSPTLLMSLCAWRRVLSCDISLAIPEMRAFLFIKILVVSRRESIFMRLQLFKNWTTGH
jgi:hypothetical protein